MPYRMLRFKTPNALAPEIVSALAADGVRHAPINIGGNVYRIEDAASDNFSQLMDALQSLEISYDRCTNAPIPHDTNYPNWLSYRPKSKMGIFMYSTGNEPPELTPL